MPATTARKRICLRGIVQGVGFRPFVFQLARHYQLHGHVRNTAEGVLMEVEGEAGTIDEFLRDVEQEHPRFARIEETVITELDPTGEPGFALRRSSDEKSRFALVPPDLATCEECRRDFTDPGNRRFGYPFTNCTNCGPRYSIIRDIPYDRPLTTMAEFRMCSACRAEYESPEDRRFHAQPNACPVCGPQLTPGVADARRRLAEGWILAIKGLGGFQLACDAENGAAVGELRRRKRRRDKPFGLMAPSLAVIEQFCLVSDAEREALLSPQRPIVILSRRSGASISDSVAPDNPSLGFMLPYTPLHHLLFAGAPYRALVMTSGNLSEEPIVTRNEDARARLSAVADSFVAHNRAIHTRVDDSVVRIFEGVPRVLRRARGFVPLPIDVGEEVTEVLACGGELKNTFCLTKGRYALLSQHIGDLENFETLEFFRETLAQMMKLFRVVPRLVAHDLHPNYLSTRFALGMDVAEKTGVQHHHAHIAACMAENHLREKVIGVALDGTGYGTDGQIWGGEFLIADLAGFERRAHLRYVPLAGGDQAIREPWRAALSYLTDALGAQHADADLPLWAAVPGTRLNVVRAMIQRRVNTVQTSSCGRLFDAVASIAGLRHEVSFEGQAAILLESVAEDGLDKRYPFEIGTAEPWQIDMRPAIREIVADVQRRAPIGAISAMFHNTVAAVIVQVCETLRRSDGLNRVCLSGGTFQNMYLLTRAVANLRAMGFDVFLHARVPPNDGGISLGQAVIGDYRFRLRSGARA